MNENVRLLVVSRESAVLRPLWSMADSHAWQIESTVTAWDAMERIQSGIAPNLLLLDLPRGDGDSLQILRWLSRLRPDLPVIVTCFPEDAGRKLEATRLGAREVLIRPWDEVELELAIRRHVASPENERADLNAHDIEQVGPDAFFVCAGPASHKLRAQAELLAEADVPVLILGEPGSGKHTFARLIHNLSPRSGFKFLRVNCANVRADALETELFGDEKFSAAAGHAGAGQLERAEKGTIFLDEIAEMPRHLQDKLMQVLQDKLLSRPGKAEATPVDVRILASTSANPERALVDQELREDLYYRLSAFAVQVPPLRQRKNEIRVLLQYLTQKLARQLGLPLRELSSATLEACQQYSWPGNLSELEIFVKRHLMTGDRALPLGELRSTWPGIDVALQNGGAHDLLAHNVPARAADLDRADPKPLKSLIQGIKRETEKTAIATALQKTGWNRKAAARLLQVSYRTLLYKIDQYQLSASKHGAPELEPAKFSLQGSAAKNHGDES